MDKKILHQPIMHATLIMSLGILAYSNTFHVPFLFDDESFILNNPEIGNLSRRIRDAFSGQVYFPNRYIGYLTFALNYRFGGFDVVGYHLVNLLIHLANALLVYALVVATFRVPFLRNSVLQGTARTAALLAGALFVVHPLQTQAVTYIVQRQATLATTFYLSTLVLYSSARLDGGGNRFFSARGRYLYLASLATAILAMRTKEIAFTLPIILFLYEFFFLEGSRRKRCLALAPHLLTLVIIPLGILDLSKPAGEVIGEFRQATQFQPTATRYEYLLTQFRVVVTYLRLLVLPIDQNLDYDYPIYTTFFTPPVYLSFLLLAALFLYAIYLHRLSSKRAADPAVRLISFGILWFFVGLSVESSIIPINDVIFEHRVYLPSVGAFIAAAVVVVVLGAKARRRGLERGLTLLVGGVVLALAVTTWMRNEVWKTPVTLWQDVVQKSPHKARASMNLGAALGEAGRIDEAIAVLSRAAQIEPGDAKIYVNLGAALATAGRSEEAIRVLSEAVRLEPDDADALNNLGIVLTNTGRLDEAIAILARSIRARPDNPVAHFNLGRAYLAAGRHAMAVAALETAVRLKPDYDNACIALATALNRSARFRDAAALLDRNQGRLADRADARFALGVAAHCAGDDATAGRELAALRRLDAQTARQLEAVLGRPCGGQ